jgi:hypothetical protein
VLETGQEQPAAVALYEQAGYVLIPNYGVYKDEPTALSYRKVLRAPEAEPVHQPRQAPRAGSAG